MRNKSVFLIIACVCGAVAAVGASQLIQGQGTTTVPTTEIFVAAREIGESTQLTADMVTLEPWPTDRVPQGTTSDLSVLEGKVAGQRFFAGEPVMLAKLTDGEQLSARIPDGFSVVSMPADAAKSIGNLVRPGDRVNVMAWFSKSDQIPETGVRTVLRGVKVYAVDGRTNRVPKASESEPTNNPSSVSLLIYKQDEEAWAYASELGRIRLSLSGPDDTADTDETRQAGMQFLKWMRDYQAGPPKVSSLASSPVEPARSGFKMLKLHGEHWTEYEIAEGTSLPLVTATSVSVSNNQGAQQPPAQNGASGLNGPISPFFEPVDASIQERTVVPPLD
jgi:pilus assembly protein CpaB